MAFSAETFRFLADLAENNDRAWFEANRARYEAAVREPALALIRALGPRLAPVLPSFEASDRKVGGSLMRVHRDTRFSKDKAPYKTNIGIQLRHVAGRDVHAPGIYLHLDGAERFVGVGLWQPEPAILETIRRRIADDGALLRSAVSDPAFAASWSTEDHAGDVLKRPPKGYPADHPMIEWLKRKSHLASSRLSHEDALAADLADRVAARLTVAVPYVRFFCDALGLPT